MRRGTGRQFRAVHGRDGGAVVVDTGPDPATVDRCLRRLRVTRIPMLMITHLHADHVGGLDGVLADRSVGVVVTGPGATGRPGGSRPGRDRATVRGADAGNEPGRAVHGRDDHRPGARRRPGRR
ncbi:MBL fold metallo-hydrolase [Rhodococcus zopfii]|uniref:MBL fold metallo-hydrolase n=1 Tax=Rhodococcus zopfii TaxID=43772 RepID=A0ABU3WM41_9NOCA|nr:MBL fold metallo-hydrolase [Rhodococcus zopfii]